MSSRRPMNGLTYFAPAFAARIAWFALKMSVVLIRTPSFDRTLIALRPSVVIWIFTTTFLWSFASCRPCLTISSAWVDVTSRLIGPSTRARMSWITSDHFRPVFATSVGFVVTPSTTPQDAASRISSMFAVSRKILTMAFRREDEGRGGLRTLTVPGHGPPPWVAEERLVEGNGRAAPLTAPGKDDGIGIAQPAASLHENHPQ